MPTYEYACSNCDTTHEVQQRMSDPTLTECPTCHEPTLRKLFRGVGIHFKGSGFYRTDSRDGKGSSSTSTTSSSDASSGSSSSASSSSSSTSSSSSSNSSSTASAAPAASTSS